MAKHLHVKKEVFPYEKFLGKKILDPEIRDRINAMEGDPKINTALFLYHLDWMLDEFRKILKDKKETKNE